MEIVNVIIGLDDSDWYSSVHVSTPLSQSIIDFIIRAPLQPLACCGQEVDRTCLRAGGIRFGMWVNVSLKGFRIKTIDFPAAGMSTDVPRPLSSASVAVRNIFLPYAFLPRGDGGGMTAGGGVSFDGKDVAELVTIADTKRKAGAVITPTRRTYRWVAVVITAACTSPRYLEVCRHPLKGGGRSFEWPLSSLKPFRETTTHDCMCLYVMIVSIIAR